MFPQKNYIRALIAASLIAGLGALRRPSESRPCLCAQSCEGTESYYL